MYTLVVIRHGESEWNQKNLFCGWTDVELTEKGYSEAREAGRLLAKEGFTFDKCYTSVLKRAIHTAYTVLDEMDLTWIPVEKNYHLGWEGCFDLVKLNLQNPEVVNYLLDSVKGWIDEFGIDGLRLDVAYSLDENFVRRLREVTGAYKQDFFLLGEMLHGDYNRLMNDQMLHSATNYECYKGLYSSFNSMNMFEIVHSLLRQFGPENWTLYKGKHLFSFVDNHDVTRVASILNNENHLPLIYAMAFGMPGIPCVYYGSEWGFKARKEDGDPALRPCFDKPEWNGLCDWISRLAEAKKHSEALNYGAFRSVLLTNKQCIFERKSEHERVLVAINADGADFMAHFDAGCGTAVDLITGEKHDFGGGSLLPAYSAYFWRMEN